MVIRTTPDYWDCECEENYIHPETCRVCKVCGADYESAPDARKNEIENKNIHLCNSMNRK